MNQGITLKLSQIMVGQILDGLRERQKVWRYTQEYMETGCTEEPCIEECSSADEDQNIVEYYEEIISSIEKQTDISEK